MSVNELEAVTEPWIFLLGRPPIEEYLGFLTQAAAGESVSTRTAAQRWRTAAGIVDELSLSEAGAADGAVLSDMPPELVPRVEKYLNEPVIQESYAFVEPTIAVVPLDKLIVFQRGVNVAYAQRLKATIGGWSITDERLLDFCLATEQAQPDISRVQPAGNSFIFQSASTDARFLGAELLPASQVQGHPAGRAHSAVVLYVGYGANALNVVNVNGRLILNNGTHRAYALMAAGITHAPAVVQTLTRSEDINIVPQVQQNMALYVGHPRPPMLKDYFAEALHDAVPVPKRVRQIRLQFGVEQFDAPG